MQTLVKIKFGSHLYGTSTPASDEDFKLVVIPSPRDLLLQRGKAVTRQGPVKVVPGQRNQPGDVDCESVALHRYLELLTQGQTMALDMLFAPDWALVGPVHQAWRVLQQNKHELLNKNAAAFVGYCRTQANRYGIRGSRVHAARALVEFLDRLLVDWPGTTKLLEFATPLEEFVQSPGLEHTVLLDIHHPAQNKPVRHLECCNRKTPLFSSLKDARALYGRVLADYGDRASAAERNEGIDWKALSHAVRVGYEALEFLNTGNITFPLINAEHVLAVKLGQVPYATVASEIENLLQEVETAESASALPQVGNQEWIDEFVFQIYKESLV